MKKLLFAIALLSAPLLADDEDESLGSLRETSFRCLEITEDNCYVLDDEGDYIPVRALLFIDGHWYYSLPDFTSRENERNH